MKFEKMYLYPDRKDITLTAYIADDSPEILNGAKRPAVIVCPGGAYMFLSDREAEPIAFQFLSMGYHAFVLHYSVLNRNETKGFPEDLTEIPEGSPDIQFPAPIRELGMAMKIVKDHSDCWLVDPDQVGVTGYSAGGHVCAAYSTFWHTDMVAGALNLDPEILRPAFCVVGYPFIDFLYNSTYDFIPYNKRAYEWMNQDIFGTPCPSEEQMKAVSPNYHVTDKNPPTFLWNCSTDNGVPAQHSLRMAYALAEAKVPFELHMFDGGPHGMSLATEATSVDSSQMSDVVAGWAESLKPWLRKYVTFPQFR